MSAEQGGEADEQRQKFLVELEFVQCLANPLYIDWLATQVKPHLFLPACMHAKTPSPASRC